MKKKITESQLRSIVEQKIDEAWYNNIDDFYHGVGKAATIGALGASTLMGGAYCLDKGLENQERYEQHLNQEAAKNSFGTEPHYQKWCEEHGLNPDDHNTLNQYNEWFEDINESKIRYMVRRAIVENYVRKELAKQLTESEYTADKFASEQDELAYQNGEKGSFLEDVTIIKFKDGESYELDDRYDDLDSIKQDLSNKGYKEGVDYKIVNKQVSRYWSV